MKANDELSDMSVDALNSELLEVRKQQFQLRLSRANGTLKMSHQITNLRRYVARIKTFMTQKAGVSDVK